MRYSYVQEYVTVEIFYLALWYFQYSVTGEQSTNSMWWAFAKPNHQWKVCTLLSYSYTLKCVFSITIVQVSAHKVVHIYWWSQRRWRVRGVFGIFGVISGDLSVLSSSKITRVTQEQSNNNILHNPQYELDPSLWHSANDDNRLDSCHTARAVLSDQSPT